MQETKLIRYSNGRHEYITTEQFNQKVENGEDFEVVAR